MIIPAYLQKGDTIGITCPAGYMAFEKAQSCIDTLKKWGYKVKIGKTLGGNSMNYFSGTDEERLADLQEMLDDDSVKAILCGRGGYGVGRIIEQLNFKKFKKKPKWIIGFSDITVLHAHILSNYNIATLHAPMAGAFNDGNNPYLQSLKKVLAGQPSKYSHKPNSYNKQGEAEGILAGGNLTLFMPPGRFIIGDQYKRQNTFYRRCRRIAVQRRPDAVPAKKKWKIGPTGGPYCWRFYRYERYRPAFW